MAGARAVQIGSGIGRKGLKVFSEVGQGLEAYLRENGHRSPLDVVGVAHAQ
jgi:dihydroorotate dehydrogenase (NAD+) catalytic subunit